MEIRHFFDPQTFTLTYIVFDQATRDAVVIDPVLDYDPLRAQVSTVSADRVLAFLDAHGLKLHYILETHAHADHLSASQLFKQRTGALVAISERITEVQRTFQGVFDLGPDFHTDGSQFDRLLSDGQTIHAGSLAIEIIATPGHTPACVTYKIADAIFTGDALFIEDYGTGRCDFPRGSAVALYRSVHERLYALPDATRVFVGHDYQPAGREVRCETTLGIEKERNRQLRASTTEAEFVAMRTQRDRMLEPPRLLYPSVQVNVDAGRLPKAHEDGRRFFKIPFSVRGG